MADYTSTDISSRERVSSAIAETVAEEESLASEDLEVVLQEAVDTDALSHLFAPRSDGTLRPGGYASFQYHGYEISILFDKRDDDVRVYTDEIK